MFSTTQIEGVIARTYRDGSNRLKDAKKEENYKYDLVGYMENDGSVRIAYEYFSKQRFGWKRGKEQLLARISHTNSSEIAKEYFGY
jgi:hypothetical protein